MKCGQSRLVVVPIRQSYVPSLVDAELSPALAAPVESHVAPRPGEPHAPVPALQLVSIARGETGE